MITLEHNGIVYDRFETADDLLAAGVPESVVKDAVQKIEWAPTRARRDAVLAESDYMAMPDYPITADQRKELEVYRKALRDIPDQGVSPEKVAWPIKPSFLK